MSKIERLLIPGSTELPDCRCGQEMALAATQNNSGGDSETRIYKCSRCRHEMRLIVWLDPPLSSDE
jgi:DNA-directed RNA polymerase subunit M/transcription elongation factor TFIIS